MAVDVVCPTCNTVSHLSDVERDAGSFCTTCDYPLFWAKRTAFAGNAIDLSEGAGLRRLPGTEGWAIGEKLICPVCAEPNLVTETFCVRCGADLHPKPLPPIFIPSTPAPALEEPRHRRRHRNWLPVLVLVGFAVECALVWYIGAYLVY